MLADPVHFDGKWKLDFRGNSAKSKLETLEILKVYLDSLAWEYTACCKIHDCNPGKMAGEDNLD